MTKTATTNFRAEDIGEFERIAGLAGIEPGRLFAGLTQALRHQLAQEQTLYMPPRLFTPRANVRALEELATLRSAAEKLAEALNPAA
jgi:hypothetical protein